MFRLTLQCTISENENWECPLCLASYPNEYFPELLSCLHRSCLDCLQQYLRIEISESRINISCPECSEAMHPNGNNTVMLSFAELLSCVSVQFKATTLDFCNWQIFVWYWTMKPCWRSMKISCCGESWLQIPIRAGVLPRTALSSFWLRDVLVVHVYFVNVLDVDPTFAITAK